MRKDGFIRGTFENSWTGGSAPLLMQREVVTVMPSCSGGDNVVVE
jgi:hypothetical protein